MYITQKVSCFTLLFLLFFVLDTEKSYSEGWPGERTFILEISAGSAYPGNEMMGILGYEFNQSTGNWDYLGSIPCGVGCWRNQSLRSYYCENNAWHLQGTFEHYHRGGKWPSDGTELPIGCVDPDKNNGALECH